MKERVTEALVYAFVGGIGTGVVQFLARGSVSLTGLAPLITAFAIVGFIKGGNTVRKNPDAKDPASAANDHEAEPQQK